MPYTVASLMETKIKRGGSARTQSADVSEMGADNALKACRKYLQDFTDEYRNLSHEEKQARIKSKIHEYVMKARPLVTGFLTPDKQLDTQLLVEWLIQEITDRGILTAPLSDPDVNEVRINGPEIWIEKKGRTMTLKDAAGNQVRFRNPEEQEIVINKLLGDTRISGVYRLVSARTAEGYRVAAVHKSAASSDPHKPYDERYAYAVLRKFETNKMDLSQIVQTRAASDSMAKLFAIFPRGGVPWMTVGPTASGKTTSNNAIIMCTPTNIRIILAQNPSEIDARQRDYQGYVINDVVHLEAVDTTGAEYAATMENIMNHILRLSPQYVCFGELRTNAEFKLAMKIALAGHPVNCTFHAENAIGAVSRFLMAYLTETPNEPPELALAELSQCLRFIVVQRIMADGTRKILQVSELVGVDPNDKTKPDIRDIFVFEPDGEPEVDAAGNVLNIHGKHKRVGKISDELVRRLKRAGVQKEQYEFLTKDPDEQETYTGKIEFDFLNKRYL
ncbi:hypothetical protein AGMMS49975_23680 [Clostridia bacterium]|nr:hypothetical protein AGMMS49975_23680 [Clostridia bacterium]